MVGKNKLAAIFVVINDRHYSERKRYDVIEKILKSSSNNRKFLFNNIVMKGRRKIKWRGIYK